MRRKRKPSQDAEEKGKIPGEVSMDDIKGLEDQVSLPAYSEEDLIPTGSTMLNLGCSDYASGGYKKGSINTLCGISDSGKTVLSLSLLASCAVRKDLEKYKLIPNNSEVKGSFDLERLFGLKPHRLSEPPGGFSGTIHQFGGSVIHLCKSKDPFIMILDSLDALKSDADFEKSTEKALKAAAGDLRAIKEIKQSYNAEKAKTIKKILNEINDLIGDTDSMLLIIQQLNQKMNATKFEEPYVAAGGNSPMYCSTCRHWLVRGGPKITKTVNKQKMEVGNSTIARCKKNHLNGKKRDVSFNIYDEYGLDDIESMCYFLSQFRWESSGDSITPSVKIHAKEFFDKQVTFRDLINHMWENPVENTIKLRELAQESWIDREKALHTGRRRVFI